MRILSLKNARRDTHIRTHEFSRHTQKGAASTSNSKIRTQPKEVGTDEIWIWIWICITQQATATAQWWWQWWW